MFNLTMLCDEYMQHHQSLCHVFVGFKKAFDSLAYNCVGNNEAV